MEKYKELSVNEIGNKAYNLKKLEDNNFNVPKWIVLPFSFLKNFNTEENINEFNSLIEKNFSDIDKFSVRTSSSIEDSSNFSFAGQFDTYLNIGKSELVTKIEKILEDLKNKNLDVYLENKEECTIGIIIQEMIIPQKSGVIFTANPQGILNESVIVVGNGVGENVVEDKENTTTYYYNLTDNLYYYSKQEEAATLTNDEIDRLIETSKEIKTLYQNEMDIEWCIKDNELFILQARPITTLSMKNIIVLDNSNIVESYPDITLPLTQSYVKEAYYRVFYKCFERVIGKKNVKEYDLVLKDMVEASNGRMYYQISNWYTMMQTLPFGEKIIPVWQEMLGVSNKSISNVKIKKKNRFAIFNVIKYLINNNSNMYKLNLEFNEMINYYNSVYNENLSNEELSKLFMFLVDRLSENWDITLINDMYAFVFTHLLNKEVKKIEPENYKIITNELITQKADIDSMKPLKDLVKLSKYLKEDIKVLNELRTLKDDNDFFEYIKDKQELRKLIENYIKQYGDRSLEELKFESKTFRSSPILLVKELIKYADNDVIINESSVGKQNKIKITRKMKRLIKRAGQGIKNRESSRLNRSRIFGMIRNIFNLIARNLYEKNEIDSIDDIYYLRYEEIISYLNNNAIDIKGLIADRKVKYTNYKLLPTYSRLVFDEKIIDKTQVNVEIDVNLKNQDKLRGIPSAGEEVIGEVLVVDDPKNVSDGVGKILVTKMTDPGWVFLLSTAKGVISEKGSILSHTAIISRELNITAVVGVKNATNILKNGDIVKVNGTTGEIEVLERV